jgi:RHH-type rel operon transcriptional repressor/antitoxin RelB
MATSIRLDPAIEQRLDHLAAVTGRTKAYYLRELIQNGLDDLEDLYLAEQRLIDVRAGKSKTYTLDEVEKRLGLAD